MPSNARLAYPDCITRKCVLGLLDILFDERRLECLPMQDWLIQILLIIKSGTRARAHNNGRKATVLLMAGLADKTNPWIKGNPVGDMPHLAFALAKYVQDTMCCTVSWVPAPSHDRIDRLDIKLLRDLLQHVIVCDPKQARDGELAIYNNLRISVPGDVDQEVRVGDVSAQCKVFTSNVYLWLQANCNWAGVDLGTSAGL
jgi:hypothetical protein